MMVMRHSERVDDCCPGWIEKCNKEGKYEPFDLNMPTRLPIQRPLKDYTRDTCITRSGAVLAQMIGRGLLMTDNTPGELTHIWHNATLSPVDSSQSSFCHNTRVTRCAILSTPKMLILQCSE